MQTYKAIYFHLFNKITDAIRVLQIAQQEAEEAYIEIEDATILSLIESNSENK